MDRQLAIELISSANHLMDACKTVEEEADTKALLEASWRFFEANPHIATNPELRKKAFALDSEQREAGDRRPYADRYAEIADQINGIADATAEQLRTALAGDLEQRTAAVRFLRGTVEVAPAEPEEAEETSTVIGYMKALRAPAMIQKGQISRMREIFE